MTLTEFKEQALRDLEIPEVLEKFYLFEDEHLYFCKNFEISTEEISLDIGK